MQMQEISEGTLVRCLRPSIDQRIGQNEIGVVKGFARFSAYHAREALVGLPDGQNGWFWLRDLEAS